MHGARAPSGHNLPAGWEATRGRGAPTAASTIREGSILFDLVPVGGILAIAAGIFIFLGWGHRVLDRMRLTDTQALVLLGIMALGFFLPAIPVGGGVKVDVGGAVAPLAVAVYLLASAGTERERVRAVLATVVTAAIIYTLDKAMPADPGRAPYALSVDPVLLPGLVGGIAGYLSGRSRRGAFIAGTTGVVLADLASYLELVVRGVPGAAAVLGGGGVFDATLVSGFLAVFLAEVVGETREFLQGGPRKDRPAGLLKGLRGRVLIGAEGGDPVADTGRKGEGAQSSQEPPDWPGTGPLVGMGIATSEGGRDEPAGPGVGSVVAALLAVSMAATANLWGPWVSGGEDEVRSGPLYTMREESGRLVLATGRVIRPGDEFIAEDNSHYLVERVRGRVARARFLRWEAMEAPGDALVAGDGVRPDPGGARVDAGLGDGLGLGRRSDDGRAPSNKKKITIGVYHTHNDESYISNQGESNVNGKGGIHRVGHTFVQTLGKKGYDTAHDQSLHLPHDQGAYRRSRRTALDLLRREKADILFDVHRDAGPQTLYAKRVKGRWVTQVRLVVGRQNPQRGETMRFAKELKAIADRRYPGLVKGIFIGRDGYNQDISPRAMLLEMGTEKNAMQSAERGIRDFADVVDIWASQRLR